MNHRSPSVLDGARKIAVLRPSAIGDFVFALPALHALKHTYPDAELALVGKAWHAGFLDGRPGPVDRVITMPDLPGIGAIAGASIEQGTVRRFLRAMRAERFDLVAQMFGGGRHSNPLVQRFGARLTIGPKADDAPPLDRWVRYAEPSNRRLALLEVAGLAGAGPPLLERELAVTELDRLEASGALPYEAGARLVLIQPGSTDPRRCWPPERFAAVADVMASSGARIAVNGTAAEAPRVRAVLQAMRQPAVDLAGRLSLRGLCGLIERAALVVSNDTGPLHLALAIGKPCVGIFWLTNLIEGTPLRQGLLSAALATRVNCPVCGAENLRSRCAHDVSFVADVTVEEVIGRAESMLGVSGSSSQR